MLFQIIRQYFEIYFNMIKIKNIYLFFISTCTNNPLLKAKAYKY